LIEKGGHTHKVAFSRLTAKALRDWLDVRPKVKSRAVFLSVRTKDHFTPDGLTVWMRRMCIKAKVPIIGPHAIRHAVGVNLSLQSQPISLLRELFGHKNTIVTAESYMPDNLDEVREMIDRFGLVGLLCDDDGEDDDQVEEGGDEVEDDGLGQAA
jgi:integrase